MLLVLAGGALIADRMNKFPLVFTFSGVYFAVCTVIGQVAPAAVAELFRAPVVEATLFLDLFMLTDPPTPPARSLDQVWIGALVAVTACAAQLAGAGPGLSAGRRAGR